MYKKLLVFTGIVLSATGISYIVFSRNQVNQLVTLDYWNRGGSDGGGGVRGRVILKDPELSRRVVAEQEVTSLSLTIKPYLGCNVRLQAPNFKVSPEEIYSFNDTDKRIGQEVSLAWALVPQKSGQFDIPVSIGYQTKVLHLKVTDVFGLSPWQAQVAAWLLNFLGIPTLTLGGLLAFIDKRKNKNKDEEKSDKPTKSGDSA